MTEETFATSLEETISRRRSTHQSGTYTTENITQQQLLEVLQAAYGYLPSGHRSVPSIGGNYSLIIYIANATGSYRYIPENNSIVLYDENVTKETIRPHDQNWPSEASAVLIIVWNKTKMGNQYFASAEAGCLVQNVYLKANSLDLGTCCVGGINSGGLRNDLHLSSNLIPLLVMPLGYPKTPYPPGSPNYDVMDGNLPPVQYSNLTLDDAIRYRRDITEWSLMNLSLQELSQLLWAAYGSTNTTHRTTPSAWGIYPLIIYVLNSTGVYRYVPEIEHKQGYYHYTEKILDGDKRYAVANVCSSQTWAADAPTIFLIAYNASFNNGNTGDGGAVSHEFIEVDAGCVIQNIYLEATAQNLGTTVIGDGLEDWNGTGAAEIRNILNLTYDIVPLYIMPVGHLPGYQLNLHVLDWDLTDSIEGAYVYKDNEVKITDANGWANWTGVSGETHIKVKYFGHWVNGTFTVYVNENKTIDVRCKIFDITITCKEGLQEAILQNANVTAFNSTSTPDNRISTALTDASGRAYLDNIPNGTITFTVYDGNGNIIANVTKTITSEGQLETVICDQNYVTAQLEWKIVQFVKSNSFSSSFILMLTIVGLVDLVKCLKQRNRSLRCKHMKRRRKKE
ncbi:hypothetical protein DRO69_11630 [Candidatus Bathyarchaeota archaeon]|nr:MAG: hypothetical protein DRO69_11630 [Candidatus Bathyarchaeota archaeon]